MAFVKFNELNWKKERPAKPGRSRLRPVSDKRKAALVDYSKARRLWLPLHPTCEATVACAGAPTRDVHHRALRSAGGLLDQTTWLAVCRGCHDWIHANARKARELGLLI